MSNLAAVFIFVPVPAVTNTYLLVSWFETVTPRFWKEMKILSSGISEQTEICFFLWCFWLSAHPDCFPWSKCCFSCLLPTFLGFLCAEGNSRSSLTGWAQPINNNTCVGTELSLFWDWVSVGREGTVLAQRDLPGLLAWKTFTPALHPEQERTLIKILSISFSKRQKMVKL